MNVGQFNWGQSVFPLMATEFGKNGEVKTMTFMGTAFFTIIEGYPLIISAAHILAKFKDNNLTPSIATRYGKRDALKLTGMIASHEKIDVAFMGIDYAIYEANKSELEAIPVSARQLNIGDDVFTIGFPHSLATRDEITLTPVLDVDQFFFKGYVTNVVDAKFRKGTDRTYMLNFPSMPGASGSPLMSLNDGKCECVGFMFDERTIMQVVDHHEVTIEGNTFNLPVYERNSFGLACDSRPLYEIRNILAKYKESEKVRTQK